MEFVQPTIKKSKRSILSILFVIIYFLLFLALSALPFIYQRLPIFSQIELERLFVLVPCAILALYALIIAFSFFGRGDNWLIFTIILLFFSTIGAVIILVLGILGGKNLFHSGIPSCWKSIVDCTAEDGVTLLSELLLGISIPTLILNTLTFVGAYTTMGSKE